MSNVWRIARLDLQIFLRSRGNLLQLLLIPVILTLVLGYALGRRRRRRAAAHPPRPARRRPQRPLRAAGGRAACAGVGPAYLPGRGRRLRRADGGVAVADHGAGARESGRSRRAAAHSARLRRRARRAAASDLAPLHSGRRAANRPGLERRAGRAAARERRHDRGRSLARSCMRRWRWRRKGARTMYWPCRIALQIPGRSAGPSCGSRRRQRRHQSPPSRAASRNRCPAWRPFTCSSA